MDKLTEIASEIRQKIDDYCLQQFGDDRRTHLGASEIDDECLRRLWYYWRWCKPKQFNARMRRLFQRGKDEENKLIRLLQGAGFNIFNVDPNTGQQYTFAEHGGHYGGSTDLIANHPIYFPNHYLICEFKTHKEKYFKQLKEKGVKVAFPKHYSQMCEYGAKFQITLGLYLATNKNDDDLHLEILELDWNLAEHLTEKAKYIIYAKEIPPRIQGASPVFYKCKQCDLIGVCHYKEPIDKNCRSCMFATPVDGAQWHCGQYDAIIPKEFIPKGCDLYRSIV